VFFLINFCTKCSCYGAEVDYLSQGKLETLQIKKTAPKQARFFTFKKSKFS